MSTLNEEQRKLATKLLIEKTDVFARNDDDIGCIQWRSDHWLGLVQKLRPPTGRGPISHCLSPRKLENVKMQVKNRWENAKLMMLNNKASNDNGRCFFIPSQIKQSYSY
jgi:hypothetical protein